jgi:deoxyribonuclease V
VNLDQLRDPPNLHDQLWGLVEQIPTGCVTTYGSLAEALGDPVAARWVGQVMLHHTHTRADECSCHRVVRAGGELGGYVDGDVRRKSRLLQDEGVEVHGGRVNLDRHRTVLRQTDPPLAKLRCLQQELVQGLSSRPPDNLPQRVGAVDVSYSSPRQAVAAYGLFDCGSDDVSSAEAIWSTSVRSSATFPYVSSYLAFRELPVLLKLVDEVRRAGKLAEVLLVDGSGILHPRRAGVAAMLGVAADVATVGVTKKRLMGEVDTKGMEPGELRPVLVDDQQLGWALRPPSGSSKPLYISPGNRADVAFCQELIMAVLARSGERRLLGPIHFVDRLSRSIARKHRA